MIHALLLLVACTITASAAYRVGHRSGYRSGLGVPQCIRLFRHFDLDFGNTARRVAIVHVTHDDTGRLTFEGRNVDLNTEETR